ncbi:hypothetical protein BCV72DRAFT_261739 [Rhizopus microsporus var. microsporus]|uniref:Uncharacterized protein n=2 Tax=Rhizopus microsporus TaxID=58291 RepID=A0A2G4SS24_RHIZD|nr:uncharacterized protein RHIMIDRAFT_292502 [Rhizopus microsporus ATCC 52813]ORE07980.1 hypothetical protein BCV72DRAFT_261739 [Rhizopus microsporus var. microsporus]PHZ11579.1 hypothetical protein RHIMIDRAFT_292502 [Rhizopus microsporus ATCC 52813]
MSFLKGRIQLSDNQDRNIRTRNTWLGYLALPCCTYLNLKRIQLPDDSDDEQLVDEQDLEYEPQPYMPSHIPTFQTQNSQQILSKNPFARAEEPSDEDGKSIQTELEDSGQTSVQAQGSEELVEFNSTSFATRNYENEPDWTELYHDDDGSDKENESKGKEEQVDALDDTQKVTEELDVFDKKQEEKIPQIEKEVLHLLPLPELSEEIPPNMIHKSLSLEISLYGEEPLTSGSRSSHRQSLSLNRFSQLSFSSYIQSAEDSSESGQQDRLMDPLSVQTEQIDKTEPTPTASSSLVDDKAEKTTVDEEVSEDPLIKSNSVINKESNSESNQNGIDFLRRGSSSFIEAAARFMTHVTGDEQPFAPMSFLSVLAESPPSAEDVTEEEEELFDFSKVVEIGKSMKSFSEELVESSIRMLNDVGTRVKTTVEQQQDDDVVSQEEEEDAHDNDWLDIHI